MKSFLQRILKMKQEKVLTDKLYHILQHFYPGYVEAAQENGHSISHLESILDTFLDLVSQQLREPYPFEPYHERIRSPFDYYSFGIEFLRPLVVFNQSKVRHTNRIKEMVEQIGQGHNVVLFANHQTEPDPQAISLLLEKTYPQFAEEMIFVAGHRVISDPLAAPFSMGRNLLCIYSKKHIDHPPERKSEKLLHNQRTMKRMNQLLSEGGKCIYVAPSGGRDRPNQEGQLELAPFDPQSIELFWLMAQQAEKPTHFYPLALSTYHLLPPPNSLEKDLGEHRHAQSTPIHLSFGSEISMENFPGAADLSKKDRRQARAEFIWNQVNLEYHHLKPNLPPKS